MSKLVKLALAFSLAGTASAYAADSAQKVLSDHVAAMGKANLNALMAGYSENAVVVAPPGIAPKLANSPQAAVLVGKANIRKLFAVLTDKDHAAGDASMVSTIETLKNGVLLLHWRQFPGTAKEVSGEDVFVIRRGKVDFQTILIDAPKTR